MYNSAQKRALKIAIASAGLGLAAFFAASTAHADNILAGGFNDGGCGAYVQAGIPGTCAVYSASIAPAGGPDTMDVSTTQGADVAEGIYLSDRGRFDTCRGFSEGSAVCLKLAERQPIHVQLDGDPYGSTGAFQNPLVGIVKPVLPLFGIPVDLPVPPGTERFFNDRDLWANGGPQNPIGLIDQASNLQDHAIQQGVPSETWVDEQGVVNNEWHSGDPMIVNGPAPELLPPAPDVLNP